MVHNMLRTSSCLRRSKSLGIFNNLSGENKRTNPKPIQEEDVKIADDLEKAEAFNKFSASVNKACK